MSDIALRWNWKLGVADPALEANDLARDDTLESAVFLSLFTDRRAEAGDVLPDGESDRRGWWADAHPAVEGDRHGSRLWLLKRAKATQATADRAREYAAESLQWLTEDLVTDRVDVKSEIVGKDILSLDVTIYRPKVDPVTFRYTYNWAAHEARRAA